MVVGQDVSDPASREAGESTALFSSAGALEPPYDPAALCLLVEHSNALLVEHSNALLVEHSNALLVEHSNALRQNLDAYCYRARWMMGSRFTLMMG